jgi:Fe-S-cluster containining protein
VTAITLPKKLNRADLPAGDCLCNHCTAKCCQYFALGLDSPTEHEDWEYIRWFLLHDAASVFMEEDTWYLLVQTRCQHLMTDNRCGIYETRPTICREYSTDNCEYEDDYLYERYLETAEQVAEYMEIMLPPKKGVGLRSAKPKLLPVIG